MRQFLRRVILKKFPFITLVGGVVLFSSGVGMRVYADITLHAVETRLIAARPVSPVSVDAPTPFAFQPADGRPDGIRLPDYNLSNTLEPVITEANLPNG